MYYQTIPKQKMRRILESPLSGITEWWTTDPLFTLHVTTSVNLTISNIQCIFSSSNNNLLILQKHYSPLSCNPSVLRMLPIAKLSVKIIRDAPRPFIIDKIPPEKRNTIDQTTCVVSHNNANYQTNKVQRNKQDP